MKLHPRITCNPWEEKKITTMYQKDLSVKNSSSSFIFHPRDDAPQLPLAARRRAQPRPTKKTITCKAAKANDPEPPSSRMYNTERASASSSPRTHQDHPPPPGTISTAGTHLPIGGISGSSHPFAETKQENPTEPTPTSTHTPELIWEEKGLTHLSPAKTVVSPDQRRGSTT